MSKSDNSTLSTFLIRVILYSLLGISLLPVLVMVVLSVKTNVEIITDFWSLPSVIHWENYPGAIETVKGSTFNSLFVTLVSCTGIVFLSSLAGFVFARHRFPGKEVLFTALIGLVMLPQVLLLVPLFVEVKSMGIADTYWALILPYMAGGQIIGILLCRGFMATIPQALFESARLDGASEFQVYRYIVLPLSLPILTAIAIINFHGIYNDFVWPLMVLQDQDLKTFAVAIFELSTVYRFEYGLTFAAYVVGSLPLVVVLLAGMKYFVRGITEGGVKA
jgi:ABC-type glycerol-3-phosphate transport system permease component